MRDRIKNTTFVSQKNAKIGRNLMLMVEIKRDRYLKQLIESRQNGFIKVITGIRRCGKSNLLNVLFYHYLVENGVVDDHIIRIDLEDQMNKEIREKVWIYLLPQSVNGKNYTCPSKSLL